MKKVLRRGSSLLFGTASVLFSYQTSMADFIDGAPAIDLVGQYDQASLSNPAPDYDKSRPNDRPNVYGLETPEGAALDATNHRLFISETANNRVLVYNLNASNLLVDRFPDRVLGQPDFASRASGLSASALSGPRGIAYSPLQNKLYVVDSGNRRVLVFNTATITNGEAAVNVLGQPDFTTGAAVVSSAGMHTPEGIAMDDEGGQLFVSDQGAHRVTAFNVVTTTNGEAAVNVVGQPDFVSSGFNTTSTGLRTPSHLAYDTPNERLFVADTGNNRVVVYDTSILSDGQAADSVICQADFTSRTAGIGAAECQQPVGLWYDDVRERLYVSEASNHRVGVFPAGPSFASTGLAATAVLGQAALGAAAAPTTSRSRISEPRGLVGNSADGRVYLLENGSSRMMIFDAAVLSNGEDAEDMIGQYDETSYTPPVPLYSKTGPGNAPNIFGLSSPRGAALDAVHHRLFVADSVNARVLVYALTAANALVDRIPDNVLGQSDFTSVDQTTTAARINGPEGLAYDSAGDRLFVSDVNGNRVLVFDTAVVTNGESAAAVLGQPSFTSNGAAVSAVGLSGPRGLAFDSSRSLLFVADGENNRVVVFDVAAVTSGEAAVNVLGQSVFTTNAGPQPPTQSSLLAPRGLAYDGAQQRLFVADTDNSRVLVFDTAALSNGAAAAAVLCQADFTSTDQDVSASRCQFPEGVVYDAGRDQLFVFDTQNHRVVAFDTSAVSNGEEAVHILGQSSFTSAVQTTSVTGYSQPVGGAFDGDRSRLYVLDSQSRVLVVPTDYAASFSGAAFAESAGGGGFVSTVITVTLTNDSWFKASGALTRGTHYTMGTLPTGLVPVVTVTSPTTATIALSGAAVNHAASNSVSGIAFSFLDAAFTNTPAAQIEGSSTVFSINFNGAAPTPTATPRPTRCFGGNLNAPKVTAQVGRAVAALPTGLAASTACQVTIKAQRTSPTKRVAKILAAGKKSAALKPLLAGKWTFFYTVKTTALGTVQTSKKKSVVIR